MFATVIMIRIFKLGKVKRSAGPNHPFLVLAIIFLILNYRDTVSHPLVLYVKHLTTK